ncbi:MULTISPECIES: Hsp20/alpha crystallin family protein [Halobaculum]|uniref:Hsp20/alpha crystallin family protein n=2 Tax=Halobaculum TaxID=43927 RepID=A0A8T8WAZ4_9EURY|nr:MULTISPECIES: Hsp20/alpha crystallin family protein [Halobaculum]QZP37007.1 Hsp20/alpha crystallin family protein [Halobaculum magnesiiphilum]QZY02056.1 Hsp20/alpha crystallin family protein [Halobaculum roseum]
MSNIAPFDEMNRMFDRMSRNVGRMDWGDLDAMRRSGIDVDIAEYDDEIVVMADLPGFDREHIDLTVRDDVLSIVAERELTRDDGDDGDTGAYLRRERRAESLRRSITLPAEVVEDDASATYSNGVLTVTLPKVHMDEEGDEGHHIEVNESD